jgi:hypothetical protein
VRPPETIMIKPPRRPVAKRILTTTFRFSDCPQTIRRLRSASEIVRVNQ